MSIVVNTPNGSIGRPIVEALLDAGEKVTILSRSPGKVADLVKRGARLVEGSTDDPRALDQALTGARALFWLTPPVLRPDYHDWAVATARAGAEAVKRHDVKRVVVLSSLGAQTGRGTGPVSPLLEIEETFRKAAPNVVSLRPGFFMENFLRNVDSIAQAGAIYAPLPVGLTMPHVATKDIAAVAVTELRAPAAAGYRVRGVHGPADLSQGEAVAILGEVLGRPVSYVQVTLDQAKAGMEGAGMPPFGVAMYVEMYTAILEGRMKPAEPRSAETTTPTPFAAFARDVLRPAVEAATPKLTNFMATLQLKPVEPTELAKLLPAEAARFAALVKAGAITKGVLSQDRRRGFIELRAPSAAAAREVLATLPLYPHMDIELVPLSPPL